MRPLRLEEKRRIDSPAVESTTLDNPTWTLEIPTWTLEIPTWTLEIPTWTLGTGEYLIQTKS